ncbi:MAG: hypothetical protein ACI9MR_001630 [Myxococcota bacterium]|jgi:hypothetical protein
MSDGRHSLHLNAPPPRVAAALRRHLEQGGFRLLRLAPGTEPAADALVCILAQGDARTTWLHLDPYDAVPEGLSRILSEVLRCEVTAIAHQDDLVVTETAAGGNVVSLLAVRDKTVLEESRSPYSERFAEGETLQTQLAEAGYGEAFRPLDAIRAGRASTLAFRLLSRPDAEVVEIDPGLSCPECGQAMQKRTGRWGDFYGCIRFPDCRGKLTDAQATAQRTATTPA